ncbi:MAG: single-stranded-DNA-specific exonuclease RecJ [candidate division Zixibacteria bacterium]|nr:single-stranded-DNA-specific exonuclease RecJ [candidate division Zixibacteria bacterium]
MSVAHKTVSPRWELAPLPERELVDSLVQEVSLPKNIVKILVNRGHQSAEAIQKFLNPELTDLKDPFEMAGMEDGVKRVTEALYNNEKILIYGDYDVDGVTATSLLYIVLNKLGANADFHVPNRLTAGYGLSIEGIDQAKKNGVGLMVTVDTGITAVEEIKYASSLGIDVVVTDHHEPGMTIPEAYAIINHKQAACNYGGELAGVGVAYKFAQALYVRLGQEASELYEHLDLVALGTSADIVPLVDENRVLTKFGIKQIARTTKPGIKSLAFVSGLMGKEIGTGQVVFILAPRINAIGRLGDARQAVRLMSTRDERLASEIARKLDSENRRRKEIDEKTLREALEQMQTTVDIENDKAIVLSAEGWHQGVIGIVASRLVERYHLPTIMIAEANGEGKGSARSIPGFHLCNALKECEHLLIRYGGHKYAAGLSIKSENIPAFRKEFKEVSARKLTVEDTTPKLYIDQEIELTDVTNAFVEALEKFSPFGPQNMRPIFLTRNCELADNPYVVGKNHLKMKVRKDGAVVDVIGFGFGHMANQLSDRGCLVDIVYALEFNTYRGVTKIQIRLRDIKPTVGEFSTGY